MDLGHKVFTHDVFDSSLDFMDGFCLSIFNYCSADGRMWTMPPVLKHPCTSSFIFSRFLRTMQREISVIMINIKSWFFRIGHSSSTRLVVQESRKYSLRSLHRERPIQRGVLNLKYRGQGGRVGPARYSLIPLHCIQIWICVLSKVVQIATLNTSLVQASRAGRKDATL